MIDFCSYYYNFLGLNLNESISISERRNKIFSFYWKIPLMITDYENRLRASTCNELAEDLKINLDITNYQTINDDLKLAVDQWFSRFSWNYHVNNYLRYSLSHSNDKIRVYAKRARLMSSEDKKIALMNLSDRSTGYQNAVWQNYFLPLIKKQHIFIVEADGKKAASAIITDIDNHGANLMIETAPEFQKKGFGKAVTALAVQWCLENNLLPCYFHDERNIPSQKLAESLDFKFKCRECNLFIHKSEAYET